MIKYVGKYIKAKVRKTKCMQEHFKQVCHTCKSYAYCDTYEHYVDTWVELQKAYKRENKHGRAADDETGKKASQ